MADPFSNAHRAAERKALKDQEKDRRDAFEAASRAAAAKRQADAKRNPNDDIGYRMRPKFYERGY